MLGTWMPSKTLLPQHFEPVNLAMEEAFQKLIQRFL